MKNKISIFFLTVNLLLLSSFVNAQKLGSIGTNGKEVVGVTFDRKLGLITDNGNSFSETKRPYYPGDLSGGLYISGSTIIAIGGVYISISTDNGSTWKENRTSIDFLTNAVVSNGKDIFIGSNEGIYVSKNFGKDGII
ncbi:MAG: hypothetical protein A2275_03930 [Bacteroidetes bacterium RIFOXYA12_FULL_35_11]|nr:MAG: hypothetical protein A2X01_02870 [Bacteroidetes bacterium GWF2_35_48]OFY73440.1 MAG: hypothetical protein A2275_03930 [Bacteroidetes bacterium RIFOXYA12_FULL_35_11]OFY93749.1 MAG: hypothetical protein A2309_14030 [Bacteroidetes bacterium RIFOXYB2_FULL_35_7]OFY94088.1 MAG: hypothetical protein A2491_19240 [Bacteroidetes bacterium RIFOXYC12_FULL_35_7]HBX51262.1 hypothetical protein [Bacteroidales bacterium]